MTDGNGRENGDPVRVRAVVSREGFKVLKGGTLRGTGRELWQVVSRTTLTGGKLEVVFEEAPWAVDTLEDRGLPSDDEARAKGYADALDRVLAMLDAGMPPELLEYTLKAWRAGAGVRVSFDLQALELVPPEEISPS